MADFEFEIVQDGMVVAGTIGADRETALRNALHYAAVYGQDGPVELLEVLRRVVEPAAPAVADTTTPAEDDTPPPADPALLASANRALKAQLDERDEAESKLLDILRGLACAYEVLPGAQIGPGSWHAHAIVALRDAEGGVK